MGVGIRHYILTRSAYGPSVSLAENRLRLELLRRVTAPSIAAQAERDVTWLALIDPLDPLLDARVRALESGGLRVLAKPARNLVRSGGADNPGGPWARYIEWGASAVCTMRLDDDDAIAPWVLASVRAKLEEHKDATPHERAVMTLPAGWRVVGPSADFFDAPRMMNWDEGVPWISQFSTLYAGPGDRATMLDVRHGLGHKLGPLHEVTGDPAWLWLRHSGARSNYTRHSRDQREGMALVTPELRAEYPIDWDYVASLETG